MFFSTSETRIGYFRDGENVLESTTLFAVSQARLLSNHFGDKSLELRKSNGETKSGRKVLIKSNV